MSSIKNKDYFTPIRLAYSAESEPVNTLTLELTSDSGLVLERLMHRFAKPLTISRLWQDLIQKRKA